MASGHALIAPSVKEKFGWTDSDVCWWCGSARQTREHLFKECITWREEIRELWKEIGEISEGVSKSVQGKKSFLFGRLQGRSLGPGNTSVRDLMADKRFIGPVLRFFRSMGAGKLRGVWFFLPAHLRRGYLRSFVYLLSLIGVVISL